MKGLMIITEAKSTSNDATMHGEDAKFEMGALEKMNNLILLQINSLTYSGECTKFPKNLRLLSWHGFSLEALPGSISLDNLVVLDMSYSKGKRVPDGFMVMIRSLRILNLSHSVELIETPDFSRLPNLERLILNGCSSLIEVKASLNKIELLDVTNCSSLRNLPPLPECLKDFRKNGCPHLQH